MTTLIKNVQIIDGTGQAPFRGDVIVKKKWISAIGAFPGYKAHLAIDGRGAYLAPGFIDTHSLVDRYLNIFSVNAQNSLLRQGITTAIGGQDGFSLAPLFYGSLASIAEWADLKKVNVNWHSVKEFLNNIGKLKINYGTLAGYRTIRNAITAEENRSPTRKEIILLKETINKSLRDGALGLSLGPRDFDGDLPYADMKKIFDIVSQNKKIISVALSGKKDKMISSWRRLINLSEECQTRVVISHFESTKGEESPRDEILEMLDSASARADIFFEIYPSDSAVFPIRNFFPAEKSARELLELLKEEKTRRDLLAQLPIMKGEEVKIVSAPGYEYLEGKNLREFSKNRGMNIYQGVLNLLEITGGRAIVSRKNINVKKNMEGVRSRNALIASADAHLKNLTDSFFPKFIYNIQKSKIIPLEAAIYKMTGLPAERLGLFDRGLIKIGYRADLVIFRDGEIKYVILGGQIAVNEGIPAERCAGEIIKAH